VGRIGRRKWEVNIEMKLIELEFEDWSRFMCLRTGSRDEGLLWK
jgi:hypothetical protein